MKNCKLKAMDQDKAPGKEVISAEAINNIVNEERRKASNLYNLSVTIPWPEEDDRPYDIIPLPFRLLEDKRVPLKWGQRKLLFTELYFILTYLQEGWKVVILYVGSAPGYHLAFIMSYFPEITWILYDPGNVGTFSEAITTREGVHIFPKLFGEDDYDIVNSIRGDKELVLFSDIRTVPSEDDLKGRSDVESATLLADYVIRDQALQRRWCEDLKPRFSYLKFKVPTPEYEYLDGVVHIQPYTGYKSYETRLLVKGDDLLQNPRLRIYDKDYYNGKLNYHNMVERLRPFDLPYGNVGNGSLPTDFDIDLIPPKYPYTDPPYPSYDFAFEVKVLLMMQEKLRAYVSDTPLTELIQQATTASYAKTQGTSFLSVRLSNIYHNVSEKSIDLIGEADPLTQDLLDQRVEVFKERDTLNDPLEVLDLIFF